MQTSNTAENTAQTSSDLKRCSGAKYPGDKTRRLTEPHMESRENFHKKFSAKDGLAYRCKSCESVYKSQKRTLPKVPPPEFMTCRECGETKHHSGMSNHSGKRTGKANICSECTNSNSSQWAKDNPEKHRARSQRRRARKKEAFVENVKPEELLELYGNRCFLGCGRDVTTLPETWHIEHVIPISRGGEHSYANCRVACADCNGSKWTDTYYEVVLSWNGHWKNFTIENLYLFNENARWHTDQLIKQAIAARDVATNTSKETQ